MSDVCVRCKAETLHSYHQTCSHECAEALLAQPRPVTDNSALIAEINSMLDSHLMLPSVQRLLLSCRAALEGKDDERDIQLPEFESLGKARLKVKKASRLDPPLEVKGDE